MLQLYNQHPFVLFLAFWACQPDTPLLLHVKAPPFPTTKVQPRHKPVVLSSPFLVLFVRVQCAPCQKGSKVTYNFERPTDTSFDVASTTLKHKKLFKQKTALHPYVAFDPTTIQRQLPYLCVCPFLTDCSEK